MKIRTYNKCNSKSMQQYGIDISAVAPFIILLEGQNSNPLSKKLKYQNYVSH